MRMLVVGCLVLSLAPAAWPQTPDEGLVAYWPMDEAEGAIARDQSGNGHYLALTNVRWG